MYITELCIFVVFIKLNQSPNYKRNVLLFYNKNVIINLNSNSRTNSLNFNLCASISALCGAFLQQMLCVLRVEKHYIKTFTIYDFYSKVIFSVDHLFKKSSL